MLSQRSQQLFDLFGQSNLVLTVLEQRRTAIRDLLSATSTLSQQITSILSVNRSQLTSLLQSLQSVSAILAKDSNDFGDAIPVLAAFSRYASKRHRLGTLRRRVGTHAPDSRQRHRPVRVQQVRVPEQQRRGRVPAMRRIPLWARLATVAVLVAAIVVGRSLPSRAAGPPR